MDLQQLRTFLAVVETESLTRAAEKLHLSQPTVSGHVRGLEEDLGVTLFHRTGRGMRLSDAGRELSEHAREIMSRSKTMEVRAAELRGEVAGLLRLGSIDCGYNLKLATSVGQLRAKHPDVRIELTVQSSGENVRALLDQELDVAFAEGEFVDSRLTLLPLGTSKLGVVGPAAWKDRAEPGDWARLAQLPWLFQSETCSYSRLLARLGERHNVKFTQEFRTDLFGAVKDLVAEGLAMSLADLASVRSLEEEGKIFIWGDFVYEMPVSVALLESRKNEPLLQSYLETHGFRVV